MKRDMRKYILRKLVELIFTLLFVTVVFLADETVIR